jgi:hypothetical protein
MYCMADKYSVPASGMAPICIALESLKPEQLLEDGMLSAMSILPDGYLETALLKKLLVKTADALVQLFHVLPATTKDAALLLFFGDAPTVIRSKELRQRFCSLPFEAVLAWVKEDNLKVHSENCVVFLLSVWVRCAISSLDLRAPFIGGDLVYINGFFFTLYATAGKADRDGAASFTLFFGVQVNPPSMREAFGAWNGWAVAIRAAVTTPVRTFILSAALWDAGFGISDSLQRSGASIEEVMAPYLVDGRLEGSVKIIRVQ